MQQSAAVNIQSEARITPEQLNNPALARRPMEILACQLQDTDFDWSILNQSLPPEHVNSDANSGDGVVVINEEVGPMVLVAVVGDVVVFVDAEVVVIASASTPIVLNE